MYASTHGHTAKIAARLAGAIRGEGLAVDLCDAWQAGNATPGRYDLDGGGGSLHKEHHQKDMVDCSSPSRCPRADDSPEAHAVH